MVRPGLDIGTRKLARLGGWPGSSKAAMTIAHSRAGARLAQLLRPLSRYPSAVRTAVAEVRPPRLGLPRAGSLAAELIRAPRSTMARQTFSKVAAGQVRVVAWRAIRPRCIQEPRPIEPSPRARRS